MYSKLKKSQITHWWVAKSNLKMAFVNILSGGDILNEELLVVGYLDKDKEELGTSSNRVVRVTRNGVITQKGTFYPFEEAHELYLQFLIEANKPNTLVAINWKYAKELGKKKIIADVIKDGNIEKEVTFDFIPSRCYNVMFVGYSEKFSANVVLSTFARRNVCKTIHIPEEVKSDIAISSFAFEEETMEKIRLIQEIFAENFESF